MTTPPGPTSGASPGPEMVDDHEEVKPAATTGEVTAEAAETVGSGSPFSCSWSSTESSSSGYHAIERRLCDAVFLMLELADVEKEAARSDDIRQVLVERLRGVVSDLLISGDQDAAEGAPACTHLASALNLVARVFDHLEGGREGMLPAALLALRGVVAACPLTEHSPDRMTAEAQDGILAAAGIVYVGLALYQNREEPCAATRSRAQDGLGFLHRSSDVREEFEVYVSRLYREVHFPHSEGSEWPEATGLVRLIRRLNDLVWAAEVTDSDAENFTHPVVCLPGSKVVIAPVSECLEGIRKGGATLLDFNVTKVDHDVIYTMWFSSDDGSIRWQLDYTYDHFLDLSRRLAKTSPSCPPLPSTKYSIITTILNHDDEIDDRLASDLGHWVKDIVKSERGPIVEQAFGLGAALRRTGGSSSDQWRGYNVNGSIPENTTWEGIAELLRPPGAHRTSTQMDSGVAHAGEETISHGPKREGTRERLQSTPEERAYEILMETRDRISSLEASAAADPSAPGASAGYRSTYLHIAKAHQELLHTLQGFHTRSRPAAVQTGPAEAPAPLVVPPESGEELRDLPNELEFSFDSPPQKPADSSGRSGGVWRSPYTDESGHASTSVRPLREAAASPESSANLSVITASTEEEQEGALKASMSQAIVAELLSGTVNTMAAVDEEDEPDPRRLWGIKDTASTADQRAGVVKEDLPNGSRGTAVDGHDDSDCMRAEEMAYSVELSAEDDIAADGDDHKPPEEAARWSRDVLMDDEPANTGEQGSTTRRSSAEAGQSDAVIPAVDQAKQKGLGESRTAEAFNSDLAGGAVEGYEEGPRSSDEVKGTERSQGEETDEASEGFGEPMTMIEKLAAAKERIEESYADSAHPRQVASVLLADCYTIHEGPSLGTGEAEDAVDGPSSGGHVAAAMEDEKEHRDGSSGGEQGRGEVERETPEEDRPEGLFKEGSGVDGGAKVLLPNPETPHIAVEDQDGDHPIPVEALVEHPGTAEASATEEEGQTTTEELSNTPTVRTARPVAKNLGIVDTFDRLVRQARAHAQPPRAAQSPPPRTRMPGEIPTAAAAAGGGGVLQTRRYYHLPEFISKGQKTLKVTVSKKRLLGGGRGGKKLFDPDPF
ncbi:Palmitoyltransferase zdhhc15 [Perkinsus olseni]|uniref:Palmitoyltransferase zdhhc15 n=1 Tax=Perkinsus olseni TaxID=32597 RepID=A0A7J6LWQ7_PEROL|nr:Palmitoyltransferase zdhhc15 [Perkinsus olseni]KAF4673690.1 Palmitoyltransferase zdhhc15 [Perkinsus olseni]